MVGAGLSGLVCATRLRAAGATVHVLEASDRAGGRTRGTTIGGARIDLGGQWIGPGQERVAAVIEELGLRTFPTRHAGWHVVDTPDGPRRYRGSIPWIGVRPLAELGAVVGRTYARSLRLSLERALDTHDALDRESVESLAGALGPPARGVFDAAFRTVFGAEARDVSLLWYLLYARAGGGFFRLTDVHGGAQERRVVEGAFTIAERLAAKLGDALTLDAPVRRVERREGEVLVHADGRAVVRARRAVVAVPLTKLGEIAFDPPLPAARVELADGARMGATVKVHALYERAFWRDRGFSGHAVSGRGPLSVVFDNTSHDGRVAALVGFVVGDEARRWSARDENERRTAVLDQLASWFGDRSRTPATFVAHDWSAEPWVSGCPVASPPPGVLARRAAALRASVGAIHWAGTETATRNPGYLDGAVAAGERAASEVLEALRST